MPIFHATQMLDSIHEGSVSLVQLVSHHLANAANAVQQRLINAFGPAIERRREFMNTADEALVDLLGAL